MALCEAVCREKDEDLDAVMSEEREERLYGQRRVNDRMKKFGESGWIEIKLILVNVNLGDHMKEVMEKNRKDRQTLENSGVFLVELIESERRHGEPLPRTGFDLSVEFEAQRTSEGMERPSPKSSRGHTQVACQHKRSSNSRATLLSA